jgi:raffinose/stachyose/melibiose transport system permease protein
MKTALNENILKSEERGLLNRRLQDRLTIFLFLLPSILFFLVFLVYPIFQSIYYSFFSWKGFGPAVDFVALDNFKQILIDKIFVKAVGNVLFLAGSALVIQLPLSMLVALLVGRDLPGRLFFRTVFFMPFVFSDVITGLIWGSMYRPDPQYGFINAILTLFPGAKAQAWLGNPDTVLACIFVALSWKYFGFHMLLYMAGLQNIPQDIEDAALVDGANGFQKFFRITLPLLGSTIRTSIYLSVLGSLQQFGLIWVMSQGGPVSASESMATYMYRYGFVRFQLGYGSAVAVILLMISLTFSLAYQKFVPQEDYLSGLRD